MDHKRGNGFADIHRRLGQLMLLRGMSPGERARASASASARLRAIAVAGPDELMVEELVAIALLHASEAKDRIFPLALEEIADLIDAGGPGDATVHR